MIAHMKKLAGAMGLELEKTTAQTAAALVGTWRTADVGTVEGCGMDEPFLEFRSDGKAYRPGGRRVLGDVTITENYVRMIEDALLGGGMTVFPMSGGFYLPSFECGLVKLERIP